MTVAQIHAVKEFLRESPKLSAVMVPRNSIGQVRHLDEFKVTNTETGLNNLHTAYSAETAALQARHFYVPCQLLLRRSPAGKWFSAVPE